MARGSFEGRLGRRARLALPQSVIIVALGGLGVCDGAHSNSVMKKIRRQIAEVRTLAAENVPSVAEFSNFSETGKRPVCPHVCRVLTPRVPSIAVSTSSLNASALRNVS